MDREYSVGDFCLWVRDSKCQLFVCYRRLLSLEQQVYAVLCVIQCSVYFILSLHQISVLSHTCIHIHTQSKQVLKVQASIHFKIERKQKIQLNAHCISSDDLPKSISKTNCLIIQFTSSKKLSKVQKKQVPKILLWFC